MTILSWNCRGLGNLQTVHDLCRLVKEKRPELVFLIETKLRQHRFDKIKNKLGFNSLFVVDYVRRSGGLALLWIDDLVVDIQNYSRCHINATIHSTEHTDAWKFTGFYGHLETGKRKEAWDLLRHLRRLEPMAWLCVSDFNEIVEESNKKGVLDAFVAKLKILKNALDLCSLNDLDYSGPLQRPTSNDTILSVFDSPEPDFPEGHPSMY